MKMITCVAYGKTARNATKIISLSMITNEEKVLNSSTINKK